MTRTSRRGLLANLVGIFWFAGVHAVTFTVTGTGDTINAVDGFLTLREAITMANATVGFDTIDFAIAGAPGTVHTISPTTPLPDITEAVLIDGYAQLGATENTAPVGTNAFLAIEIDGTGAGIATAGLNINAPGTTIQGLVIRNFGDDGISSVGGGVTIRGNFIGTDQTGKLDRGNGVAGIALESSNNIVGGTSLADRNLISGNTFAGIAIAGVLPAGNRVENNLIGTDDTGAAPLANSAAGVQFTSGLNNTIGGILAGTGNVIAYNALAGVSVTSLAGNGNFIGGNSIHSNGELGIDLDPVGVTLNDADDVDAGPNALQNFPLLTEATSNGLGTTVEGTLNSTLGTAFRIEVFSNTAADASGSGEGQRYLGFVDIVTDGSGDAEFSFTSPIELPADTFLTATATDASNNTSEFSVALEVEIVPPVVADVDDDDGDDEDDDGPFPVPVPVPVPPPPGAPLDPVVAPVVAPAVPVIADTTPFDRAPKAEYEITVDGLEDGLDTTPSSRSSTGGKNANREASGCSTTGGSVSLLWCILVTLYGLRRNLRRRS